MGVVVENDGIVQEKKEYKVNITDDGFLLVYVPDSEDVVDSKYEFKYWIDG